MAASGGYVMCQICHSYHDSVEELNVHYESDHPMGNRGGKMGEERFPCEFCDKSFSRTDHVYRHQRKVHGRESEKVERRTGRGKFLCSVCGKRLAYHGDLLRHLRVNHGVGTDPSEVALRKNCS